MSTDLINGHRAVIDALNTKLAAVEKQRDDLLAKVRAALGVYANQASWQMIYDRNGEGWYSRYSPGTSQAEERPWLPAQQTLKEL